MEDQLDKLREFHRRFGAWLEDEPTVDVPEEVVALRFELIREELEEYREAAGRGDLVGVADALTDLLYVVLGTYVSHGLHRHAAPLFDEVHDSNMSKLDERGRPIHRDDGKVLKSDRFREPDLEGILEATGGDPREKRGDP